MQLDLNEEERASLARTLSEALSDLSSEIADTDNAEYRRGLQAHRDTLLAISGRLQG
jgi:hypothetical protein